MAINHLRDRALALVFFLLASCAMKLPTTHVNVGAILQAPGQFEGKRLAVAGCLIRAPVPGWNYDMLLLAPDCSFDVRSDLSPLAAHVLDVTVSGSSDRSGLKPGKILLDATFKPYGRGTNWVNFNLRGVSTTGELVVASK